MSGTTQESIYRLDGLEIQLPPLEQASEAIIQFIIAQQATIDDLSLRAEQMQQPTKHNDDGPDQRRPSLPAEPLTGVICCKGGAAD